MHLSGFSWNPLTCRRLGIDTERLARVAECAGWRNNRLPGREERGRVPGAVTRVAVTPDMSTLPHYTLSPDVHF